MATRNFCFSVAAIPIAVVDTVGAGDASMAALLAGLADINLLSTEGLAECTTSGGKVLHRFADQAMAAVALTYARLGPTRRRRRSCGVSRRGVVRPADGRATYAAAG